MKIIRRAGSFIARRLRSMGTALRRHAFWFWWWACVVAALFLIYIGLERLSWMPFLLLYASWTVHGLREHHRAMREADKVLADIRTLQNKVRKTSDRWMRMLDRRASLLRQKESEVDRLMMGIAAGGGTVERMKITLTKEGDDA